MFENLQMTSRESRIPQKKMSEKQLKRYYEDNGVIVYSGKELEERRKNDWKNAKNILNVVHSFSK